ncbi:MAG: Lrp/AsnC family transcriptional regulator [Pseudomonadota bacterium]
MTKWLVKMIDDVDSKLISELAMDSRMSTSRLAQKLGLARSTVQSRIDRLHARGVITGYTIRLGEAATLRRIKTTVLMQIDPREQARVISRLKAIAEVETVHTTTGRFDLIGVLSTETTSALDDVLDRIGAISGVKSSESLVHLSTKFDRSLSA